MQPLARILILWIAECFTANAWLVAEPKENIWVTLAKTLRQDNICLPMGSTDNLCAACLVGIPLKANNCSFVGETPNPVDSWDKWTRILPHAPEEPQELEVLESAKVTYCIRFACKRVT